MKTISSILIMLLVQFLVNAQENTLGMSVGYATNGIALQASYNHGISEKEYLQGAVYLSFCKTKHENIDIPYTDISANIGYFYTLYMDRLNRFNFSIGGGGVIGYESINKGKPELVTGALINGESQLIYGAYVGAETHVLVSDQIAISAILNQYYHINSDLGNHTFYGGIGVKYFLF